MLEVASLVHLILHTLVYKKMLIREIQGDNVQSLYRALWTGKFEYGN